MTTRSLARVAADRAPRPDAMAQVVPISDRALLERHQKGDRDAFAQLMNHYANSVYGYLSRCGVRPADRDDLFQDVFEKVHRASQ